MMIAKHQLAYILNYIKTRNLSFKYKIKKDLKIFFYFITPNITSQIRNENKRI